MSAATSPNGAADDLRPHYDFAAFPGGVRGRFFARHWGRLVSTPTAGHTAGAPSAQYSLAGEFIDHMHKLMVPMLSRCTLPIYCGIGDSLTRGGSGTLLEIGDTVFVVTAAHLTWPRGPDGRPVPPDPKKPDGEQRVLLFSGAPSPGAHLEVLAGEAVYVDNPSADLGVIALSVESAAALSGYRPLTLRHIDWAGRRPTAGWYVAYGYPGEFIDLRQQERRITVEPLLYGGPARVEDPQRLPDADPELHLLLDVPADGTTNANGHLTVLPWAGGLSGCSLWQCFYPGLRPELWSPNDAQVVAVQTCAYDPKGDHRPPYTIRGTSWRIVADLIREGWPHLAPALSLEVPDPHPAAV